MEGAKWKDSKSVGALVVNQEKEWSEILTGFEARNIYVVMDASGRLLYMAAEAESSFWMKFK